VERVRGGIAGKKILCAERTIVNGKNLRVSDTPFSLGIENKGNKFLLR